MEKLSIKEKLELTHMCYYKNIMREEDLLTLKDIKWMKKYLCFMHDRINSLEKQIKLTEDIERCVTYD